MRRRTKFAGSGLLVLAVVVAAGAVDAQGLVCVPNEAPVAVCAPFVLVPADPDSCEWNLDSSMLGFGVDPEGHDTACFAGHTSGAGLQMIQSGVRCADACGAVSAHECRTLLVPVDVTPATITVARPVVRLDAEPGGVLPWTRITELCEIDWSDNCTPSRAVQRGIINVTSSDPNEVIGGGMGGFRSQHFAADWHRVVMGLDLDGLESRRYEITWATLDAYLNFSMAHCAIEISEPVPTDRPIADLTAPADGATVDGPTAFRGTAGGPGFQGWELAIAPAGAEEMLDNPEFVVMSAPFAVNDGVFYTIFPPHWFDGDYVARLLVRGENGDASDLISFTLPFCDVPERCNGVDDNCDGIVDEGFGLGAACSAGIGVCMQGGEMVCDPDSHGLNTMCDAVPGAPADDEVCNDQLDNNCDGEVDEDKCAGLDSDGDGIAEFIDNCPDAHNPQQTDIDNDGVGNECDETCHGWHVFGWFTHPDDNFVVDEAPTPLRATVGGDECVFWEVSVVADEPGWESVIDAEFPVAGYFMPVEDELVWEIDPDLLGPGSFVAGLRAYTFDFDAPWLDFRRFTVAP